MVLYHYLVVGIVWSVYGLYCYMQYSDNLKATPWFYVVGVVYALGASLMWVYLSQKLDQKNTLDYALLWDGGAHLVAFTVPILIMGDKIKLHTGIGMTLIFTGLMIVLFYEKVTGIS